MHKLQVSSNTVYYHKCKCYSKTPAFYPNSRILEQSLVLSFPFSLFTATCASCRLPQWQNFSFLEQSTSRILNVATDHSCCI